MTYQTLPTYRLLPVPTYSAFSHPHRKDPSYQIHLIKADDPAYIPDDFEVWPIFYQTILKVLVKYPDIHDEAVEAVRKTSEELKGLQNRAIPPGTGPKLY